MARIRSIHPGLTSDEAYMSMTMTAKAAWPVLWTECDDHGVFEWKPIVLKARIFPADNVDFAAVLQEYEDLGAVQRVEIGGKPYGFIRNFCKYQRPKNPSYRHDLPEGMRVFVGLPGSTPPALPEDSPCAPEIPPQMEDEGGSREEEENKTDTRAVADATRPDAVSSFGEFWLAYPRRQGANPREPAFEKFKARVKSGVDPGQIIAAAKRYADEVRASGQFGTAYVAQAVTWLKQSRWSDYGEPATSNAAVDDGKFYAPADSLELATWDMDYRQRTGKGAPRDKNGGWRFPTRWPPGYAPPKNNAPVTPAINLRPM